MTDIATYPADWKYRVQFLFNALIEFAARQHRAEVVDLECGGDSECSSDSIIADFPEKCIDLVERFKIGD